MIFTFISFFQTPSKRKYNKMLLMMGIILLALNLRPAITSVGPLIVLIRSELNLSNSIAGLLTTIPLLAFSLTSPVVSKISIRKGHEFTILIGLTVLTFGICVRSIPWATTLILGSVLIGIGIAMGTVILPGIVKYYFPAKVGLLTSIYSTTMGMSASLASGFSIPLTNYIGMGWNASLLFWSIFGILAIIIWYTLFTFRGNQKNLIQEDIGKSAKSLFRSNIAWKVTFFMGFQSLLFFSLVSWLPTILQSKGITTSLSGWMLSILLLVGLPGNFLAPIIANRSKSQSGLAVSIALLFFIGIFGIWQVSTINLLMFFVILVGIVQGAGFSLALTFLVLRTKNSKQAMQLSGMAQSMGYLIAAIGPIFLGFLYDQFQTWTVSIIILLISTIFMGYLGHGAGRNSYVFLTKKV
nr:MFS transporter [Anaerobacillus isosaccharinicus]MBA5586447.1 MFS transporter [Anaerobacillus isosaccharinicus]QOY35310.1 MFS transporter [Anaerobacillus isosaccharinicus]